MTSRLRRVFLAPLVAMLPLLALAKPSTVPELGLPTGYTSYFYGTRCPNGWSSVADGYVIHSRTDGTGTNKKGNKFTSTVVRTHTHTSGSGTFTGFSGLMPSPSRSPTGGDTSYDLCPDSNSDTFSSSTTAATSFTGPFATLMLCTVGNNHADRQFKTIGLDVVGFFDTASCPDNNGWASYDASHGRFLVARSTLGSPNDNAGAALADKEDISHAHSWSVSMTTSQRFLSVPTGPDGLDRQLAHGTYGASGTSSTDSIDLPHYQLSTCYRNAGAAFATCLPTDALVFSATSSCPSGWTFHTTYAGRLLVSAGTGLTRGTLFGSGSLFSTHTHTSSASWLGSARNINVSTGGYGGFAVRQTYSLTVNYAAAGLVPVREMNLCHISAQKIKECRTKTMTFSSSSTYTPTITTPPTPTQTYSYSESTTVSESNPTPSDGRLSISPSLSYSESGTFSDSLTASERQLSIFDRAGLFYFSPHFRNVGFTSKRYMLSVPSALSAQPKPNFQWIVTDRRLDLHLMQFHTTSNYDYVDLAGQRCSGFAGPVGGIPLAEPASTFTCRSGHMCWFHPRRIVLEPHTVTLNGGPRILPPTCSDTVLFFGQVAVRGKFGNGPLYYESSPTATARAPLLESTKNVDLTTPRGTTSVALPRRTATRLSKYEQVPVELSATMTRATCDIFDLTSYDAFAGVGIGDIAPCLLPIPGGGSTSCLTAEDFHRQCSQSIDCVGYTSAVVSPNGEALGRDDVTYSERPLFLHQRFTGHTPQERIIDLRTYGSGVVGVTYYQKVPIANRTCRFPVTSSGRVSVTLQQTFFERNYAQVFTVNARGDRVLQAECGGLRSFAGRRFGENNQCGTYLECLQTISLEAGSTVEVEASSNLVMSGCTDGALSVVATLEPAPPDADQTGGGGAAGSSYVPVDVTGYGKRQLYTPSSPNSEVILNAYVHDSDNVMVKIAQTTYACDTQRPCLSYGAVVNVSIADVDPGASTGRVQVAAVGGGAQFPNGNGRSGQCDLLYDASPRFLNYSLVRSTVTNRSTFRGLVVLRLDADFIRSSPSTFTLTSFCTEFNAFVYGRRRATLTGQTPVFPLTEDFSTSRPIVLVPQDTAVALGAPDNKVAMNQYLRDQIILARVATDQPGLTAARSDFYSEELFRYGPLNDLYHAYYVDWGALLLGGAATLVNVTYAMSPNITIACIADFVGAAQHTCRIPVPKRANHVSVKVAQSDFAENEIQVDFEDARGSVFLTKTKKCGGANPFFGKAGLRAECEAYQTCYGSFMYDAVQDFGSISFIRLTVSNTLLARSCNFALATIVEFSERRFGDASNCTGFFCSADRNCIGKEDVCDGVKKDCADFEDEQLCEKWYLAEENVRVNLPAVVVAGNVTTVGQCRREAVFVRGTAFLFNAANDSCTVYSEASIKSIQARPSRVVTTDGNGTLFYVRLPDKRLYQRCSKQLHCSNSGTLLNAATLQDGDQCLCNCDPEYTGTDCSQLKLLGVPVAFFGVLLNDGTVPVLLPAIEAALQAGNKAISVVVGSFLPFNATHAAVPFEFSSFDAIAAKTYVANIFLQSTLLTINRRLESLEQSLMAFIFASDSLNAFTTIGSCNANAADRWDCGLRSSTGTSVRRVRVDTTGMGSGAFRVVLTTTSPRRQDGGVADVAPHLAQHDREHAQRFVTRRAARYMYPEQATATNGEVAVTCDSESSADTKANLLTPCFPRSCVVPTSVDNVTAVRVEPVGTQPNCERRLSWGTTEAPVMPNDTATEPVVVQRTSRKSFLIGAGSTLGYMLLALIIGGITLWFLMRKLLEARRNLIKDLPSTANEDVSFDSSVYLNATESQQKPAGFRAPKWFLDAMARESGDKTAGTQNACLTIFLSISVVIAVAGLLFVMYGTSLGLESNYVVVAEFYPSSACGGPRTVSTLPLKLAGILATGECNTMKFIGSSDGTLFGAATCAFDPVNTNEVLATVALAPTRRSCQTAGLVETRPTQCIPVQALLPGTFQEGYVRLRCLEKEDAEATIELLGNQTPAEPQTRLLFTAAPPNQTRPGIGGNATEGDQHFTWPFAHRSEVSVATSHYREDIGSMYDAERYVLGFARQRLVTQLFDEIFDAPTEFLELADNGATAALERELRGTLNNLSLTSLEESWVVPRRLDYPVGMIFHGYNTANEVRGLSTGPDAHRYFHVAGTTFDAGRYFNSASTDNGDGMTIRFWLRAGPRTEGFAFVICDHLENIEQRTSPVVERLFGIAQDGAETSRRWFNNSFRVYGSFYVSGQSRAMQWLTASPEDGVEKALWETETLGIDHVFNGLWHHVVLKFKNENGRTFVALGVDGDLRVNEPGWRKCLSERRIEPIRDNPAVLVPNAWDPARYVALQGGVLFLGYLNGGVHALEYLAEVVPNDKVVREGTHAMRIHNAGRKVSYMTVFYGMMAAIAVSAAVSLRFLQQLMGEVSETQITEAEGERKYRKNVRVMFPQESGYRPLPFGVARQLLNWPSAPFHLLVQDCILCPLEVPGDKGSVKMVRALWLANRELDATADGNKIDWDEDEKSGPTVAQWEEMLSTLVEDIETHMEEMTKRAEILGDGGAKFGARGKVNANGMAKGRVAGGSFNAVHPAIMSIIATIQSAGIYFSTFDPPESVSRTMGALFSAFNLEFFGNNALTVAIVQLGITVILLCMLAFVLIKDDEKFFVNVAQYQYRRDKLIGRQRFGQSETVLGKLNPLMTKYHSPCTYEYDVTLLPPVHRPHVETFLNPTGNDKDNANAETDRLVVGTVVGDEFKIDRTGLVKSDPPPGSADWPRKPPPGAAAPMSPVDVDANGNPLSFDDGAKTEASAQPEREAPEGPPTLMPIGLKCPEHNSYLLGMPQTDVFPYSNRRRCCVVDNGKRCNRAEGVIFCCYSTSVSTRGLPCCAYAVCDDHCNGPIVPKIVLSTIGGVKHKLRGGITWVINYAVISASLALYIPVLKTALMILGCHPLFQCVFPTCWSPVSTTFASSVYLSLFTILTYGIGFPTVFVGMLRARQRILNVIFKSSLYRGVFTKPLDDIFDEAPFRRRAHRSMAFRFFSNVAPWMDENAVYDHDAKKWMWKKDAPAPVAPASGDESDIFASVAPLPTVEHTAAPPLESTKYGRRPLVLPSGEVDGRWTPEGSDEEPTLDAKGRPVSRGASRGGHRPAKNVPEDAAAARRRRQSLRRDSLLVPTLESSERAPAEGPTTAPATDDRLVDPLAINTYEEHRGPPSGTDDQKSDDDERKLADPRESTIGSGLRPPDLLGDGSYKSAREASPGGPVSGADGVPPVAKPSKPLALNLGGMRQFAGIMKVKKKVMEKVRKYRKRTKREKAPPVVDGINSSHEVKEAEWFRFIISDISALVPLYQTIKFERIHIIPIITVAKFLLLVPPIMLEPDSFIQLLFIAVGELLYCVFINAAQPFLTLWMNIIVNLSSIHQFIVVAMQAYMQAHSKDKDLRDMVGTVLICNTLGYLALVACCLTAMLVLPVIQSVFNNRGFVSRMQQYGLMRCLQQPSYFDPFKGVTRREAPEGINWADRFDWGDSDVDIVGETHTFKSFRNADQQRRIGYFDNVASDCEIYEDSDEEAAFMMLFEVDEGSQSKEIDSKAGPAPFETTLRSGAAAVSTKRADFSDSSDDGAAGDDDAVNALDMTSSAKKKKKTLNLAKPKAWDELLARMHAKKAAHKLKANLLAKKNLFGKKSE